MLFALYSPLFGTLGILFFESISGGSYCTLYNMRLLGLSWEVAFNWLESLSISIIYVIRAFQVIFSDGFHDTEKSKFSYISEANE